MKLPRLRFTVRRLMVLVAVVAVLLVAIPELWRWAERRRDGFRVLSLFHRLKSIDTADFGPSERAQLAERRFRLRQSYHREMADMYRQAARYPWLPVASGPPEPR